MEKGVVIDSQTRYMLISPITKNCCGFGVAGCLIKKATATRISLQSATGKFQGYQNYVLQNAHMHVTILIYFATKTIFFETYALK